MCLRDVVEIMLPLKEMADHMLRTGCISTGDQRDLTNNQLSRRKRWNLLFQTLSMSLKSKSCVLEIFSQYMKNYKIPTPSTLHKILSDGFPCVCKEPLQKNETEDNSAQNQDHVCRKCLSKRKEKRQEEAAKRNGRVAEPHEDDRLFEPEDWYPELRPPAGRKEDIFRPEDFTAVDDKARAAPRSLRGSFEDLIAYLTEGLTSDLERTRAIFTWMGAQKIASQTTDETEPVEPGTPEAYIRKASQNNSFIPKLFAVLCRRADIPCILVLGKSKCSGYAAGDQVIPYHTSWATVFIDGHWRFVHPQWAFECLQNADTGSWLLVEEDGKAVREKAKGTGGTTVDRFDEYYFLTNPEELNSVCHAEDPSKQLLHTPWTMADFVKTPYLHKGYFKTPWKLLSAYGAVLEPLDGTVCIDFQHPVDGKAQLRYKLYFNEELSGCAFPTDLQSDLDLYVVRLREQKGIKSLLIRLPIPGVYKIDVNGVYNGEYTSLGEFRINSKAAATRDPFPSNPPIGFGFDESVTHAGLSHPSHTDAVVPVQRGQDVSFKFQVRSDRAVSAKLRHHKHKPEDLAGLVGVMNQDDGKTTIRVAVPKDEATTEFALEVNLGRKHALDSFVNVLNYLLTEDKEAYDASHDESKEIHRELFEALNADDSGRLDKAVARYDTAGFNDPQTRDRIRAKQAAYERIREELQSAVRGRNIERINYAMNQFIIHKLEDHNDLNHAVQRICGLGEPVVRQAMSKRSLDHLDLTLKRMTSTRAEETARGTAWFQEAESMLEQLQCYTFCARALTATALLGLGKLPANQHLLNALRATFFLLGESPKVLQNWVSIQTKLREKGNKGLAYGIKNFDPKQLLMTHVAHAQEALRECDPDVVRSKSDLAGLLYDWCTNRIKEFEGHL
nr:hypothetical protein BaRGS_010065 [Batillaria attramentaria]